jgi:hypothetical protein
MAYVTEDQQTDRRIKVYRLTTSLLDAVFELPTWCCINQWSREAAIAAIERCQPILRLVQDAVRALGAMDDIDEPSRAVAQFAAEACSECQTEIDFVRCELLPYAN